MTAGNRHGGVAIETLQQIKKDFEKEEQGKTVEKIKIGKDARIDKILPEVCKMFAIECKEGCIDLINGYLSNFFLRCGKLRGC